MLLPLPKPAPNPSPPEETIIKWQPPSIDWDPWRCRSAFREDDPYAQMDQVAITSLTFSIIINISQIWLKYITSVRIIMILQFRSLQLDFLFPHPDQTAGCSYIPLSIMVKFWQLLTYLTIASKLAIHNTCKILAHG